MRKHKITHRLLFELLTVLLCVGMLCNFIVPALENVTLKNVQATKNVLAVYLPRAKCSAVFF